MRWGETMVLCDNCGFQRGKRISTLGLVKWSTRWFPSPPHGHLCKFGVYVGQPDHSTRGSPQHIHSINPNPIWQPIGIRIEIKKAILCYHYLSKLFKTDPFNINKPGYIVFAFLKTYIYMKNLVNLIILPFIFCAIWKGHIIQVRCLAEFLYCYLVIWR